LKRGENNAKKIEDITENVGEVQAALDLHKQEVKFVFCYSFVHKSSGSRSSDQHANSDQ
jgi:hypothetical protein